MVGNRAVRLMSGAFTATILAGTAAFSPAQAALYPLTIYNGADTGTANFSGTVEITNPDDNNVTFVFDNTSTPGLNAPADDPSIGTIWFAASNLDTLTIGTQTGVSFASPGTGGPAQPPGGFNNTEFRFRATNQGTSPTNGSGIFPTGDLLTLNGHFSVGTFAGLLTQLVTNGGIAAQVQSCTTTGASCEVSAVPVPGAAWLFGSAFLGLCWLGRRAGMRGVGMLPA
jgi:hypothetical protein